MIHSFMRLAALGVVLTASIASAVPITIVYQDGAGEGFNDPTPSGDSTLGHRRRQAFEYAAAIWSARLGGTSTVVIGAKFDPLPGGPTSATLGQAGANNLHSGFPGAPDPNVWYATALANQLVTPATDLNLTTAEITATFNSDVDNSIVLGNIGWYYGLDENAGSNISLVRTCLHEFGHGLGFFGVPASDANGNPTGGYLAGRPSIYDNFVQQGGPGAGTLLTTMTTSARLSSLTSDTLYWNGGNVQASVGSRPRLYAPATWSGGSSYSHYREGTPIGGIEELMEPALNSDTVKLTNTDDLLTDLGWSIVGPAIQPAMDITSGPATISEGSALGGVFTVQLSAPSTQTITAELQFNPAGTDTATMGADYSFFPSDRLLVFNPGETSKTITIIAEGDASAESSESVTVRLTRLIGAEFGTFPTIQRTASVLNVVPSLNESWMNY